MTERHVCSLELSRRLAAAGFPQECVFAWHEQEGHFGVWQPELRDIVRGCTRLCAAPLLSEIMEQMPGHVCAVGHSKSSGWWAEHSTSVGTITGPTGPDAAALLWLALRGGA